ncbi:MAG: dihydropteroate synthase [Candidatus Eiseniibacteriota bacterium]
MEAELRDIIPPRDPQRRTRLLGILNLTPDSFHDGGRDASVEDSVARARAMVEAGADALDLGAESSRPGAAPVSEREELDRLLPVLERVVELGVTVSVDTVKAGVARRALQAGATLVNDVSALSSDPAMADVCAEAGAAVILMHRRGRPQDMQSLADYDDVVGEVLRYLEGRLRAAIRSGIDERRILVDPGIGFAKTAEQSLEVVSRLGELRSLGRPVVLGASRKSFLSRYSGKETTERLPGTIAVTALAVLAGVEVIRVHDVAENAAAARTIEAVLSRRPGIAAARSTVEERC